MKRIIISLFLIILVLPSFSQVFKGRVTSQDGSPLPYAALYLRELSSGFVTDDNGNFQSTLPSGKYTCEVSSLGYNKQILNIEVPTNGLTMNIVLTEHVYQLKEVQITQSDEDPAYTVMRNAIANAPRYRYKVSRYTADTYLKGSGKLTDIPSILLLSKEVRTEMNKYMNRTFLLEEQRKVTYTAPNNWENEVIAYSNTFPENIMIMFETTDINLYTPKLFGRVSPISAGAFSYYTYKLEGCVSEGEYLINKIKVIPRKDSPELLSGYLYIVENLWCLSGVELSLEGNGMTGKAKVSCNELQPSLFLATSISLETLFSLFGLKAEAAYLSSIKYQSVEIATHNFISSLTDSLSKQPVSLTQLTGKQQKTLDKISELSTKDDLSTRDAYKLSRLLEKSIQQTDTVKPRYKYERRARNYHSKTDSLATKRDSIYWESVRSVPLNDEELASYAYKKTLEQDTVAKDSTGKKHIGKELLQILLMGKTYQTKNKKAWLTLKDFLSIVPEYNFVDGLWLGATFQAGAKLGEYTTLRFTPRAYYTTARKEWLGSGKLSLEYAPRRLGYLWIEGGATSADFNGRSGEYRLINSYTSLIFGRSDIKFYNKKYFSVGNQFELTNSMLFTSILDWERRESLENLTNKSLFGRHHVKPNIPVNAGYNPMPANDLLKATLSLLYTPAHYYRMIHGRKVYENSSYPTFGVLYQQAFSHGGNSKLTPAFKKMELSVEQKIDFGLFNNLQYYLNGGLFWDAESVQFPDYKHFATTKLQVTDRTFNHGFSLLDNYEMSTNTRWAQANIMWTSPYLLLKQLPFLKRKTFDEALHLRTLFIYDRKPYAELGYSIGFMDMGRVGVFVGFDRLKYRSVGLSVSFPILSIMRD